MSHQRTKHHTGPSLTWAMGGHSVQSAAQAVLLVLLCKLEWWAKLNILKRVWESWAGSFEGHSVEPRLMCERLSAPDDSCLLMYQFYPTAYRP